MAEWCPSESEEQQALFRWAAYSGGKHPELGVLYHIPNEGKRSRAAGGRMKAEGLRSGVPDLCLPVARGGFSALYIEMKRANGGRVSETQRAWIDALNRAGNRAVVCHGWIEARAAIEEYLEGKHE